jgi:hypothetical protein
VVVEVVVVDDVDVVVGGGRVTVGVLRAFWSARRFRT